MLIVKFTTAYKKSYKLMKKRGKNMSLLDSVIDDLRRGKALEERYCDHELKGSLKGFRECHIQPDWLLIYLIDKRYSYTDAGGYRKPFGSSSNMICQFMQAGIVLSF